MNGLRPVQTSSSDILRHVGEAVYEWDLKTDRLYWSDNAPEILGISDPEKLATGRAFMTIVSEDSPANRSSAVNSGASSDNGEGVPFQVEYSIATAPGATFDVLWIEDTGRWFGDKDGKPARALGTIRVVNERHNLQQELVRLTKYDPLTRLPSRVILNEVLEKIAERVRTEETVCAFVLLSVERLDLVNLTFGSEAGDEVLRAVGERITRCLRSGDFVARFSGSKFGIVLENCNARDLHVAGERFTRAISDNVIKTSAGPAAMSTAIGAAMMPKHATSASEAAFMAMIALERSRRENDPTVNTYYPTPGFRERARKNSELAFQIVDAIENKRMALAFQPIVSAKSHKVAFHEALLRMNQVDGTVTEAAGFIGVAEDLGMIRMVDHQALDLALETLNRYRDARLSVNVSNDTVADKSWLAKLKQGIAAGHGMAERLIVEITESQAAHSLDETLRFINEIRQMGAKIAIDDFGAGYTSFSNLKHLPIDIIKIDGCFVNELSTSRENQIFVRSLLQLTQAFQVETVIEWVDNDDTAILLKDWGVDYLQGYSFGAPLLASPWRDSDPDGVADHESGAAATTVHA